MLTAHGPLLDVPGTLRQAGINMRLFADSPPIPE